MTKKSIFGLLLAFALSLTLIPLAQAEEITGTADDTSGVFIYSAGSEESAAGACDGTPAGEPTADIIQDAIDFGILEFVGDEAQEVLDFTTGGEQETPVAGQVDTTELEVVTGLTAIDDFGDISNGGDDDANFDTGTSGEFFGGLRNPYQVITADGVIADGVLGGLTAATSAAEADANLGGMEIFIFEDAELSGYQLELYSPLNTYIINFDDFQINPGAVNAADDILFGIDLDSLPGWDGTYITDMRLTDDGVEQATVDSCTGTGAADQSLEIDAIATRTSVIVELGALSGNVSEDTNNDDVGDVNLEGVVLELLDGNGNPVLNGNGNPLTTTTDADGNYIFPNLVPGDYIVIEQQPAGLVDVLEVDGGDDGDQPDDGVTNSIPATVDAGETDTGNDFVEEAPGTISGAVLEDTDGDGIGDAPLDGVVLELLDENGAPVLDENGDPVTATTAPDGSFTFDDIPPGDYTIIEQQPDGYIDVSEADGGDDGDNPDDGIVNSIPVTVDPGEDDTGNNFVEILPGSISGNVSEDTTTDGIDSADVPLSGWTLSLLDENGDPVLDENGDPVTTTTDPTGNYIFEDLLPGVYTVIETQEDGFVDVTEFDGGDDGDNPDNGIVNNIPVTLLPAEDDTGNDFIETQLEFTAVSLTGVDANGVSTGIWMALVAITLVGITTVARRRETA